MSSDATLKIQNEVQRGKGTVASEASVLASLSDAELVSEWLRRGTRYMAPDVRDEFLRRMWARIEVEWEESGVLAIPRREWAPPALTPAQVRFAGARQYRYGKRAR